MKENIKLKTSWTEISISEFKEIERVRKQLLEEGELSELEVLCRLLPTISDVEDPEYFFNIPLNKINDIAKEVTFLSEEVKPTFQKKYIIQDKKLNLIPNANLFTAAQYIDFMNYMQLEERDYKLLLSCVLVPDGTTYAEGYDPLKLAEAIEEEMPITDAVGIAVFFSIVYKSLIKATLTYSIRKARKALKKEKNLPKKEMMLESIKRMEDFLKDDLDSL